MADIVLCYSNQDKLFADQLNQILQISGFDVWDFPQTQPGTKWEDEWFKVLREAQVLIVLVSPASMDTSSPHIYRAWNYFLVARKTIIPVILPNTAEETIPEELQAIFYVDFRSSNIALSPLALQPPQAAGQNTPIQRLVDTLNNRLRPVENRDTLIEFSNVGTLTPEALENVVMPYVMALSSLQDMMDQVKGNKIQPHRISRIVHYNPTVMEILGLDGVVEALLDETVPSRRRKIRAETEKMVAETEKARAETSKTIADEDKARAETEKIRAETAGIRIENMKKFQALGENILEIYEVAQSMADRSAPPDFLPEERRFLATQMVPHVRTILQSSIEVRRVEQLSADTGWRQVN